MVKVEMIIFLLLFYCNVLSRQLKVNSMYYCFFKCGNVDNEYVEKDYIIYNDTNEEYLIWVSSSSTFGKSQEQLMKEMFFKQIGDFSLFQLMTDCYIDSYGLWGIGCNFIKKLLPGTEFSFYILLKERDIFSYSDWIVCIRRVDVEQFLKIEIDDKFCFKGNHVAFFW